MKTLILLAVLAAPPGLGGPDAGHRAGRSYSLMPGPETAYFFRSAHPYRAPLAGPQTPPLPGANLRRGAPQGRNPATNASRRGVNLDRERPTAGVIARFDLP